MGSAEAEAWRMGERSGGGETDDRDPGQVGRGPGSARSGPAVTGWIGLGGMSGRGVDAINAGGKLVGMSRPDWSISFVLQAETRPGGAESVIEQRCWRGTCKGGLWKSARRLCLLRGLRRRTY